MNETRTTVLVELPFGKTLKQKRDSIGTAGYLACNVVGNYGFLVPGKLHSMYVEQFGPLRRDLYVLQYGKNSNGFKKLDPAKSVTVKPAWYTCPDSFGCEMKEAIGKGKEFIVVDAPVHRLVESNIELVKRYAVKLGLGDIPMGDVLEGYEALQLILADVTYLEEQMATVE
jgi:hypothetical protein